MRETAMYIKQDLDKVINNLNHDIRIIKKDRTALNRKSLAFKKAHSTEILITKGPDRGYTSTEWHTPSRENRETYDQMMSEWYKLNKEIEVHRALLKSAKAWTRAYDNAQLDG